MSPAMGYLAGWLDNLYFNWKNKVHPGRSLLFEDGWGSSACIEAVSHRLLHPGTIYPIDVRWRSSWQQLNGHHVRDGYFLSPCFEEHLPPESARVNFRMILPDPPVTCPIVLHPATTREDDYRSRQITAMALANHGIGAILMEGPFRGSRRPGYQRSANLARFSDFFLLCGSAIEESRSLLQWLYSAGYRKLGIAGISKGGYIASVAGIHSDMPLGIVTLVAPHSGVPVFLEGLIQGMCHWEKMQSTCGSDPVRNKLRRVFATTGLDNMAEPGADKKMIVIVAANDRFVPRSSYETMSRHWRNIDFRWLPGGHVSSILDRKYFIRAICDAMARGEA
jgi:hypothetical protein